MFLKQQNYWYLGSFSIYEQPKWERIVASTQVGFRVSIWVRIRIRVRVRLGLYFGCSYIEKGPVSLPLHTLMFLANSAIGKHFKEAHGSLAHFNEGQTIRIRIRTV